MKRLLTAVAIVFLTALSTALCAAPAPRYIFLFIGDGMSTPQRLLAEEFAKRTGRGELAMNHFAFRADTRTQSANAPVTDSAAAATAIACGEKTNNGTLGLRPDGSRLESVAELAKKRGLKVGLVTPVPIVHATPAGFYAHQPNRKMNYRIGLDLLASGFDYFAAGGVYDNYDDRDNPAYRGNLIALAKAKGYVVNRDDRAGWAALKKGARAWNIFGDFGMQLVIDADGSQPTLAELVAKGIEVLENPKGFFLMCEGGKIDYACHANDAATAIAETLAFNDAIKVALAFAARHPADTLILTTGDHETGGLVIDPKNPALRVEILAAQKISVEKYSARVKDRIRKTNGRVTLDDLRAELKDFFGLDAFTPAETKSLEDALAKDVAKIASKVKDTTAHDVKRRYVFAQAVKNVLNARAGVIWKSMGHTDMPTFTSAQGCRADIVSGMRENCDISIRLKALLREGSAKSSFPPQNAERVAAIEATLSDKPTLPCPAPTDRAAWAPFAEAAGVEMLFERAETALREPPPDLPEDLYLEFTRNGNRSHYEKPYFSRFQRLQDLTLAECLEWKGRFLPGIECYLRAIVDEKVWNLPAHDRRLTAWNKGQINVDLFGSERAWGVALVLRLLEGKLDPDLASRALTLVRERAIDPYLRYARGLDKLSDHSFWWVVSENNWNRVCNAGCCCAALAVCESRRERAEAIELSERSLAPYLRGFAADGYCEEGMGYWNYGFGNHLVLGLAVRHATRGFVDQFADPKNLAVATSPIRLALDETRLTPLFADGGGKPSAVEMELISRIWPGKVPLSFMSGVDLFPVTLSQYPALAIFVERAFGGGPRKEGGSRSVAASDKDAPLPRCDNFEVSGILVSRLCDGTGFAAVMKPYNLGFNHCHSDAGSYVVSEDGVELAGDCGGEQYTSRTFSSHRFDSKVLNSYGHPVPVVDGQLQRNDKGCTKILSRTLAPDCETLVVDLAPAYPKAKTLRKLVRTFVFDHAARTFAVTDEVAFASPSRFETALVTGDPKRLAGRYEVAVSGGAWTNLTEEIDNPNRRRIHRIAIRLAEPVLTAKVSVTFKARAPRPFARSAYLDLMERAVRAYSPERAAAFTDRNEREGVIEHGFPRLAANLAILIAHGRFAERKAEAQRMLDICCRDVQRKMPAGTGGGNDFSVKELVFAIEELERARTYPAEVTAKWRERITGAVAKRIYSHQPKPGLATSGNWCVFAAASEQARLSHGLGGDPAFVERYLADQMRFFDANGMYMDPNQPMVYDFVTRLQFATALASGYDGPSRDRLERLMDRGREPTLALQSRTGEIPFGGRSNQFLHNETFYAALCEWYAARARQRGDIPLARRFRAAAQRAVASLDRWLKHPDVRHVKNRYPLETGYGCEGYAYFDKYMITMGSWAYLAFRYADETIEPAPKAERDVTLALTDPFHRVIVNVGDYTAEFDWNAQSGYDANGLGRFQRRGAPPQIALSVPCPTKPHYRLDITNAQPLAFAPAGWKGSKPIKVWKGKVAFACGASRWESRLTEKGLRMTLSGKGEQTFVIPAFMTDGERSAEIAHDAHALTVDFDGWRFTCKTNGTLVDTNAICGNRNGHYRRFEAKADSRLTLDLAIIHR